MTKNNKKLIIRNSTAEFLIFTSQANEEGIEVRVEDENVWLTQKLIAKLFDVEINTINYHLKEIFKARELSPESTIRNFRIVQKEGNREVSRDIEHYNLEGIIAIGFRVNSERATNFRIWANQVLKDFAIRGYVLDDVRLKNGAYLSKQYFKDLILEIRDIRESERNFYQQITDIYATAIDYDLNSPTTKDFFAAVQNKLHFATHGYTASELITKRADHKKDFMGLTTWKKAPDGKILKSDVVIAKNYLNEKEIKFLNRIVTMYLDYAESQAEKGIPMTMADWSEKLNAFLKFNDADILQNAGKVTAEVARSFAESEFEKYRPIQDKLFESDFDRQIKKFLKSKR
ncbi:cell filamentation protein Fic [Candidatus Desantisbacteria bacterium CG2_30_40_21]|uniref:Cell filamentation protein Fic n=5 Tax=unclassified Candidatus Desantisiibacteriota TaxID=3106372 RepID=A0A2M7JB61_9BACT|nr:MAG: cell filamentation protein Fic [Candidatus Desantisbacteria bacterium CG2_30_40_21]PIP41162.1 MAG: cell filamentation protein Fic [Candidatus Desantisbacteria bacterium CG23_combo_of_CG06-09_8_20_14_all_40_23]PIX16621.1 MAG: cell filamentation protein Fic [Candidatus Desantisbacteria bacterium CG_4_8_14_3_um_filter_40_12]PIY20565.1 MAG: cell filamentation protein Fic [Candidatus Desantisbacteria bacterium CG_4_10_14_3_um_filter_40_18]PJB30160.1 MAG: cell filamentation protein Fic [Candi